MPDTRDWVGLAGREVDARVPRGTQASGRRGMGWFATYREALRTELQAAGIAADDDLVPLVFAAVDGLVFQQVCLGGPAAAQGALARMRTLLSHLR